MFWYLLKYYTIIAVAATLPIMIVLATLPQQSTVALVFASLRWAGLVTAYLTNHYFESRNYWILFKNLQLAPFPMFIGATVLFESIVLTAQICWMT